MRFGTSRPPASSSDAADMAVPDARTTASERIAAAAAGTEGCVAQLNLTSAGCGTASVACTETGTALMCSTRQDEFDVGSTHPGDIATKCAIGPDVSPGEDDDVSSDSRLFKPRAKRDNEARPTRTRPTRTRDSDADTGAETDVR